ncbi:MAG: glycosyltransferase family 4 protein [Sedimentisphaerales bacterium]|nr:glycosyltransferase family 4 protein [Sedimentisphaerales bacterium]
MKIVQFTPGSGDNFYCENCLRDNLLVRALRRGGQDALLVPLYLPGRLEDTGRDSPAPLFFGGINVYLQQKFSWFRRTPRWLDRLWDSRRLLGWVARKARMTNAAALGATTLSMLRGQEGRQKKELDRLVDWLAAERPDIVCLSNALLSGLIRQIKRRLGIPVVCFLQDEDEFLDSLPEPYRRNCWRELAVRLGEADGLVAASGYYARTMQRRLEMSPDRIQVIYNGLELDGYRPAEAPPEPPTIGFLSRMCLEKGLDILAEAFLLLKRQEGFRTLRLHIGGGRMASDGDFVRQVENRLRAAGVLADVTIWDSFDHRQRRDFLRGLSVLSVPQRQPEACGLFVLEAWACGIPVVQPAIGVFEELWRLIPAGRLYQTNDPETLAEALAEVLDDPARIREWQVMAPQRMPEHFSSEATARKLTALYERLTAV